MSRILSKEWYLLETGARSGKENMDIDCHLVHLLRTFWNRAFFPTLRFYTWSPWAISLGYHQRSEEIDDERCVSEGIDIVRRPTGGRAVLHAEELTYSVVMVTHSAFGGLDIYTAIGRALVRGLRLLGVNAELVAEPVPSKTGQTDSQTLHWHRSSVACFASSARSEIQVAGKKLVGSAQRRFSMPDGSMAYVVLQHGSILIGKAHRRLPEFVRGDDRVRKYLQEELATKSTELETLLRRRLAIEEVSAAVRQGFEEELGIVFRTPPDGLFPFLAESQSAQRGADQRPYPYEWVTDGSAC